MNVTMLLLSLKCNQLHSGIHYSAVCLGWQNDRMLIWVPPYIYSNNHTLEVGEDKIYNPFLLIVSNLFKKKTVYGTKM